jgi:hypothetical protein
MLANLKKRLNNVREFVWPLLEPLELSQPKQISQEDCKWGEDETDMILEYIEKYQQSEENRKKDVESKSTIFIGTFGVAITVLISLIKDIISSTEPYSIFKLVLVSTMILAIIYLCRAVWFSIKVLERRKYYVFTFPEFMLKSTWDKKRQIIIRKYNNVKRNQDEINIMVDYMTMAQEYFKRAIAVVAIFSSTLLISYLISYTIFGKWLLGLIDWIFDKSLPHCEEIEQRLFEVVKWMSNKQFIISGLLLSILILIIIIFILAYKLNKNRR